MGILVGYINYGYRVLVNGKIIESRHVNVIDKDIDLICTEEGNNDENENEEFFIQTKPSNILDNENDYELIENSMNETDNNKNCQCTETNESNDDVFIDDNENDKKVEIIPTET